MTEKEFKNLKAGDIVIGKASGNEYVITNNYGDYVTINVIIIKECEITNSDEWDLIKKKEEKLKNNKRKCACGCGADISNKHSNARFLNHKHKDKFHNLNNPRGKFAHLNVKYMSNDEYYYSTTHPFSSEALGQD